jgi:hypothetical protein
MISCASFGRCSAPVSERFLRLLASTVATLHVPQREVVVPGCAAFCADQLRAPTPSTEQDLSFSEQGSCRCLATSSFLDRSRGTATTGCAAAKASESTRLPGVSAWSRRCASARALTGLMSCSSGAASSALAYSSFRSRMSRQSYRDRNGSFFAAGRSGRLTALRGWAPTCIGCQGMAKGSARTIVGRPGFTGARRDAVAV